MISTLLGIKKGMTSTYDSRGRRVGATVVEISPNFVTQIKTTESKDGYSAIQLGFGTKKSVKKPQLGHGRKAGVEKPIRWFREIRIKNQESRITDDVKPGTEINLAQVFSIGDSVKVSGISKGKGFQGGVRRWGFHGGPKTHGQSDRHRAPGSIGSGTTPGRVYKGKKMAGHMGSETVSTKNLEVVALDKEKNLLTIKGAIPGSTGGLIKVEKLGRVKGYTPPPEEKEEESEEITANTSEVKSEVTEENTSEVKEEEQNAS
ncbi:50S ribosomal protein L3 [Candidatus Daviesbacteria bacterium RIFCSPHIGHO2_12_FULL_37_11]|uniref:Large ribosomal subunit protein uL3 n=1 Tax=Candidatus Daviesbacteria bacterium RIFCSPHIGHO2_12_FULL_37_11 TaxID=1797777 RepID=A0A1F5KCR5_9BACT|nr:MAG: 50S ribosomal protein L3 [Candidatus Daviesbacteria bacterium GWA1_38_6]OGE16470.1 MAG: 50S ribosomal protein L3 [Candidatus Daviesbacteria bacterium RIFCSPHIGHO2_01_FULL_37_27]OGE38565.1 MAG: 50S ribosomal protein L3 [Candidatus Daviesbacteria bacterium RIFCSPHIGHO2_12_FULL_37_11]OGE46276.1 MAG: 50S ribosomal protein L3 [Candidatus Daviesbacteria bacterium RIFCSPLOWO2_01_FULL_37_10]